VRAQDVLSYSFGAIRLRKLRAGLTTLGVIIGIAAIVALLSITQGLQATITRQLQTGFATNTLIVSTGAGVGGGLGGSAGGGVNSGFKLLVTYAGKIDTLTNVDNSTPVIQRSGTISFGGKVLNATIVGVDLPVYESIYSSTFEAESGVLPANPGNDTIIVGQRVSDPGNNGTLFCRTGDTVQLAWVNATFNMSVTETYASNVTAVLNEIGGFGIGGLSDYNVYIPLNQAESFFGTNQCNSIIVQLSSDQQATINSVSSEIKDAFSDLVSVTSATAVLNILSNVFSVIQLFLGGVAAIALLVAGIGIMNIMIVSLIERTREIGILKALGMKNGTVLSVFLCESVIIGLIGAVIGIASGWTLANLVALFIGRRGGLIAAANQAAANTRMTISPLLTPTVTLLALVFGVGVSAVFALYPAWRASKLKPVEALRYE
jgi:putative ABC transport system permease protein